MHTAELVCFSVHVFRWPVGAGNLRPTVRDQMSNMSTKFLRLHSLPVWVEMEYRVDGDVWREVDRTMPHEQPELTGAAYPDWLLALGHDKCSTVRPNNKLH